MRARSNKTAGIYRKWTPIRNQFLIEFPFCMVCGTSRELGVHEITNGPNRMLGFVERATWLAACSVCNCHVLTDKNDWPIEKQLALKFWYDPEHFDLGAVNRIYGCNKATAAGVLENLLQLRIGGQLAA